MTKDPSTNKISEPKVDLSTNANRRRKKVGPNTDWDKEFLPVVKEQLEDFDSQGIKPTFRGMYYTLVELGLLAKTQEMYQALNKVSVRWREHRLIPMDCFADTIRHIIKDFDDVYETPQDYVGRGINHLEYAGEHYKIPRWHKQPHCVEIWLEKDAAVGTLDSIVKRAGKDVVVTPNRGHGSLSFVWDNIQRLKEKQREGKIIHVLYFGDLDPSGEVMDKVYKRKFYEYGIFNVDFVRLAVNSEQMKKFNLLHDPDPKTLEKLKKDPNKEVFKKKYNLKSDSELFSVQLEAMQTPKVRR